MSVGPEDFRGSDYLSPEEEAAEIEERRRKKQISLLPPGVPISPELVVKQAILSVRVVKARSKDRDEKLRLASAIVCLEEALDRINGGE